MARDVFEIAEVIDKDAGYVVEIRGIYVSRMRNGKYHVVSERGIEPIEKVFDDNFSAANYFCDLRASFKLGFDFDDKPTKIELPIVSRELPVMGGEMFFG